MTTPNAQERLDLRIPADTKRKLRRASALQGVSLSEFLVRAAEAEAERTLEGATTMVLDNDAFDRFVAACDEAREPNEALRAATRIARERGIV